MSNMPVEKIIWLLESLEGKLSTAQANGFNITDEEIEAVAEAIERLE